MASIGSPSRLLHDLIGLDELLVVADVLSGVLDFGQQEVVDDLDDHRGAHLGEREVARCQQRLVIDGIKGVVGQASKRRLAVAADSDGAICLSSRSARLRHRGAT